MTTQKANLEIRCDVAGCDNLATHFFKMREEDSNYESIKLCDDCIKELNKIFSKIIKKEKNCEKQKS